MLQFFILLSCETNQFHINYDTSFSTLPVHYNYFFTPQYKKNNYHLLTLTKSYKKKSLSESIPWCTIFKFQSCINPNIFRLYHTKSSYPEKNHYIMPVHIRQTYSHPHVSLYVFFKSLSDKVCGNSPRFLPTSARNITVALYTADFLPGISCFL